MENTKKEHHVDSKTQRLITGTIFAVVATILLYFSSTTLHILQSILSGLMFYELHNIFQATNEERILGVFVLLIQQLLSFYSTSFTIEAFPIISFFIYITYSLYSHDIIKVMKLFFGSLWSLHLVFFAVGITFVTNSTLPTLYVVFLSCCNDGFQYAFGRLFGKHKPFTYLSPNKSIEGYIGGFITLLFIGFLAEENIFFITLMFVFGVIGDLVASGLKRQLDIKDFGSVLPGMGGMFDRMDSISINVCVAYYWYLIVGFKPGFIMKCLLCYVYFDNDYCSA
ncbi:Phosphatidate cytidylyltransferase [Entamoeba marina]